MSETVIIDPLIKQLMDSAATGEAAKMFLRSGLGIHLTEQASIEVEEAIAELIDTPATDAVAIAEQQTRIKVASKAITWLTDAISAGDNALAQIHEHED